MIGPDVEEAPPAQGLWRSPPPRDAAAQLAPEPADPARFAALLDGLLAGVGGPAVILDTRGRIERINPRAARQTGLAPGDAFLERLVRPSPVRASIEGEIAEGQPLAFVAAPGIEWRTFPIRTPDGGLVGTAVFADL